MPLTSKTLAAHRTGTVFIETGLMEGKGVAKALEAGFTTVYSIEIAQQYIDNVSKKFQSEIDNGKLKIVQGDSKVMMAKVLEEIDEPVTFWLDAHWDFGPAKGEVACPIYEELTAIRNHHIKTHTILIDDMRIFGTNHHWGKNVSKDKTVELVREINKNYKISFVEGDLGSGGIVQNDIMVAKV